MTTEHFEKEIRNTPSYNSDYSNSAEIEKFIGRNKENSRYVMLKDQCHFVMGDKHIIDPYLIWATHKKSLPHPQHADLCLLSAWLAMEYLAEN